MTYQTPPHVVRVMVDLIDSAPAPLHLDAQLMRGKLIEAIAEYLDER
jgi:hypothetical protein